MRKALCKCTRVSKMRKQVLKQTSRVRGKEDTQSQIWTSCEWSRREPPDRMSLAITLALALSRLWYTFSTVTIYCIVLNRLRYHMYLNIQISCCWRPSAVWPDAKVRFTISSKFIRSEGQVWYTGMRVLVFPVRVCVHVVLSLIFLSFPHPNFISRCFAQAGAFRHVAFDVCRCVLMHVRLFNCEWAYVSICEYVWLSVPGLVWVCCKCVCVVWAMLGARGVRWAGPLWGVDLANWAEEKIKRRNSTAHCVQMVKGLTL